MKEDFLRPGQEVKFKKQFGALHNGIIKSVWISSDGFLYQVQYFNQGIMQEPYVPKEMIEPVYGEPIGAGFQIKGPK